MTENVIFKRWDTPTKYNLLDILPELARTQKDTQFHIWNCGEFEWPEYEVAMANNTAFHRALVENNNWITHWVGRLPLPSSPPYTFPSIPNHKEIYLPTHWIDETIRLNEGLVIDPSQFDIDKLFICLNGAGRYHRRKLVQELINHSLFAEGYVSWYGPTYSGSKSWSISHHTDNINPPQEMFNPDVHLFVLDSQRNKTEHSIQHYQHQLPPEGNRALLSIVTESTTEQFFLTEKTAVPILFGKPFLALACQHYHKTLIDEFGFRPYDIFDYSFDDEPDEGRRIQGILNNLHALKNQNYQSLHDAILSDSIYNRDRLLQLSKKSPWSQTKKSFEKIKKGLTFFEPVL